MRGAAFFSSRAARYGAARCGAALLAVGLAACGGKSDGDVDNPSASGAASSGGGGASGGSANGGSSGSDGGTGGTTSTPGSVEEACELFGERYADCTSAADCPFEEGLTPCQSYCLGTRSCASVDEEQSAPELRYGYAECFDACASGFYCPDEQVILEAFRVCDGVDNCDGGLDERAESCAAGTGYGCGDETIERRQVCDGTAQCADDSDEATCPAFVCHDGTQVIPEEQLCDHASTDCADGSDEASCLVP